MQYITTKTLFRIKLLFIIGTIVIVGIVILDVLYHISDRSPSLGRKGSKSGNLQQDFQKCDELLHARLWQLQDMDQQFASMVSSQDDQSSLSKTNASIQLVEETFRKSIDSISRIGASYDEESGTNDFQNMITFFKKILENRRFIAFTRTSIISSSGGPTTERQTILKLQNELYEKDRLIAASATNKTVVNLQAQLSEKDKQIMTLQGQVQKEQAEKQGYTETTQRLQNELAEKDKIIASLGNNKTSNDQKALVNLQTELASKNKQITTLQNQLQTDKQSYTLAVQRLQADVTEKDKIIAANSKKLPADQKAVANLQAEIGAKNKQISNLQAQLQSEKQSYSQTVQKLQGEITEKNKLIVSNSSKKLPSDQKAVANLENEIAVKNKQITDLQTQVQKEQTDKKSYAQSIQKYQADLAQKSKMIDALSNIKIPTDDKAVANLQKELSAKNKQINELEAALASSSNKQPADQKGLVSLQNELTAKNKQIDNLQTQVRKETAEKQQFSKTVHDLQLELIEKNKLIASAGNRKVPTDQKALVTLQNEIVEKDKRIRMLEGQLQSGVVATRAVGGESVRDLEQRNNNLRLAYNNTMTQLGVLQKKYNVLKAEMDQMKGQQ